MRDEYISMIRTKQPLEDRMAEKTRSRKASFAIWAFFVILTALAMYVVIAYPQEGY